MCSKLYRYTSAGYRDWINYQTKYEFDEGIIKYLGPPVSHFLRINEIDVAGILIAIRRAISGQGVVDTIDPN